MNTKHTPGPWKLESQPETSWHVSTIRSPDGKWLADTASHNARLIAAAPTMYNYLTVLADSGDNKAREIISQITRS